MDNEIQKLYEVLSRKGYYTKSIEDFTSQFSDAEYRDKVYGVVSKDGLYTKSKEEFESKYYKKKDSTESQSTGNQENTSSVSADDYDKSIEENNKPVERPKAPGWIENIKDGSPLKKRGAEIKDTSVTEGEEKALEVKKKADAASISELSEEETAASDYNQYDNIYDEAGVPEELRPGRFIDSESVVASNMAMDGARKGRQVSQIVQEYEGLYEEKTANNRFTSGSPTKTASEASRMTQEELAFKKEQATKEINEIMGYDSNTSFEEAKDRAYETHAYSKSILADVALERAKQEYIEDKALTTKGEILSGQAFFGEFMEGLGNSTADPVVKKIGANAAIAYFDATGQYEKAEMVALEMQQDNIDNMLRVGLDPNDSRGITESWRDGDEANAALKFVFYGSQSVGLMAATVVNPAIGMTLMGVSSGLDTYAGYRDRLDLSSEDKITLAVAAGAAEVVMGKVLGGLSNLRRFRSAIGVSDNIGTASLTARRAAYNKAIKYLGPYSKKVSSVLSKPGVRAAGRFIYDTSAEVVEETAVEFTNQLFAHAIAGEEFDALALADAAILGGGMGATMAGVTANASYGIESSLYNKPLKENMAEYEELQTMYQDLKESARREKDPKKKKIILSEAASVRADGQKLIQKANQAYGKLRFEEKAQLVSLNKGITKLISDIKESPNKTLKSRLKNELVAKLMQKAQLESKAGVELQVESNEQQELQDLQTREKTSASVSKAEGVPLYTALELVEQLAAKRAEAKESLDKSTPSKLINKRVRFLNPATNETVEGTLIKDGQRLAVETDEGNIIDIDSYEKSEKRPLKDLGLSVSESIVEPNEDGSFTYKAKGGPAPQGAVMVNNNGVKAIKRNKDGSVKNVTLTSPDGATTYNLKGEDAEEAAYQILIKERQTPEGAAKVDEAFAKEAELTKLAEEGDSKKPEAKVAESLAPETETKESSEPVASDKRIEGVDKLSDRLATDLTRMLSAIIHLSPNQTVVVLDSNQQVKDKWKEISGKDADKTLKGFNDPGTQTIYISKESTLSDRRSDGLHVAKHEMIHPIINALKSDPVFLEKIYSQARDIVLNSKGNRISQLVFAHASQYKGEQYKEEFIVEFLNFFSNKSKLEAVLKEQPSIKNQIINFVNSVLERLGITFKFSPTSPNKDVLELLNQVKQGFDSGTPITLKKATENSEGALQAYKGITEQNPVSLTQGLAKELITLIEGGYRAFYAGNAANVSALQDKKGVGVGDAGKGRSAARADRYDADSLQKVNLFKNISEQLATLPVLSINKKLAEELGDDFSKLTDVLTQLGYKTISASPEMIMAAPAFQDLFKEKSSLENISNTDFVTPSKETSNNLGNKAVSNLDAVAKVIGVDIKYINNSLINIASGYLKPSSNNKLKSPAVVVNLALADKDSSMFGLSALVVESLRKAGGKRGREDGTSFLFNIEKEVREASNKLQGDPDSLTAREKNIIIPILFTAQSYLAQSSKVYGDTNETGNSLVYAITSHLSNTLSDVLGTANEAVRTGLAGEIETAFLEEINKDSYTQLETTEGMPFHKLLKLVFIDKALEKAVTPDSLTDSLKKAWLEMLSTPANDFNYELAKFTTIVQRKGLDNVVLAPSPGYKFTKEQVEIIKAIIDGAVASANMSIEQSLIFNMSMEVPNYLASREFAEANARLEKAMADLNDFKETHLETIEEMGGMAYNSQATVMEQLEVALTPMGSMIPKIAKNLKESISNAKIIPSIDTAKAEEIGNNSSPEEMVKGLQKLMDKEQYYSSNLAEGLGTNGIEALGELIKKTRVKEVIIEIPNAPEGYRYILYTFSNGGALQNLHDRTTDVAFKVKTDIASIQEAMGKDPRYSKKDISDYATARENTVKESGGKRIELFGYGNLPASWGAGMAVATPLMEFLQDVGIQTGAQSFGFSPAEASIDKNWEVSELIRSGASVEFANKYGFKKSEASDSGAGGDTRAMLYNAWAARQMGNDVLITKNQQDYMVTDPVSGNVYLIGRTTVHGNIIGNDQRKALKEMYKNPAIAEDISNIMSGNTDALRIEDLKIDEIAADYGLKPLSIKEIADIAKSSGVSLPPNSSDNEKKDALIQSYNSRNIFNSRKALAKNIVMPSMMSYVSENADGVLSLPPLTKPSGLELQAYIDGKVEESMLIEQMEAQREENEAAIKEATTFKWWKWAPMAKSWINRDQGLRDALTKGLGAYTRSLLTRRSGAVRYADSQFKKYEADIFKGLSIADEKILDDLIYLRRVIQIDKNRDFKKGAAEVDLERAKIAQEVLKQKRKKAKTKAEKEAIIQELIEQAEYIKAIDKRITEAARPQHPSSSSFDMEMNLENAVKTISAYEANFIRKHGKDGQKKFDDLNERADKYFDAFSDVLGMARDAGLINNETYDRFKNDDYSPRVFLEHFFGDTHNGAFQGSNLSEEFILSLKGGSNSTIFSDARMLLSTALRSVRAKGHQNEMMTQMHLEAIKRDFVGVDFMKNLNVNKKLGIEPADKGFINVFYRVEGELKGFQIESKLEPSLKGNVKDYVDMKPGLRKAIGLITGSTALKMFATGTSTAFAITAFVRFIPEVVYGRGVYDKKGKGFVPAMMAYAAVDSLIGLKDALFNPALVEEYMANGGATTWMASMGKPKKVMQRSSKGAISSAASKIINSVFNVASFAGEKSELAVRLAIYSRVKKDLRAEFPNMPEAELQSLATEEALMLADFSTSGTVARDVDAAMPYFNAAIQGFRGAASYAKNNPKKFLSKQGQMFAGAFLISLVNQLAADDDEWEKISDYKKTMFTFIPIGKNAEGKMQYLTVPRAHTFLGTTALAEIAANHMVDIIRGKKVEWDNQGIKADMLNDAGYIFDAAIKAVPLPSIPPAMNAYIAYAYNYDTWSGQKIYKKNSSKEMEAYIEGQLDPNTRDFFKVIALEAYDKTNGSVDISAKRMQAALEKIIVGDRNILVDKIYDFADLMFVAGDSYYNTAEKHHMILTEKERYKKVSDLQTALGLKGRVYVTPDKKWDTSKRVRDIKKKANTEIFIKVKSVSTLAEPFLGKKLIEIPPATKAKIKEIADGDAIFEKKLINHFFYRYRAKLVDGRFTDVYFSDNKQEKIAKIEDILESNIQDVSGEDFKLVLKDLATAGMSDGEIKELYLEYKTQHNKK